MHELKNLLPAAAHRYRVQLFFILFSIHNPFSYKNSKPLKSSTNHANKSNNFVSEFIPYTTSYTPLILHKSYFFIFAL